jgi:hypothetical protein
VGKGGWRFVNLVASEGQQFRINAVPFGCRGIAGTAIA